MNELKNLIITFILLFLFNIGMFLDYPYRFISFAIVGYLAGENYRLLKKSDD